MPKRSSDKNTTKQNPLVKTLGMNRMFKLRQIDEFLSMRGIDNNPASFSEICRYLGVRDRNKQRGVRSNIQSLCELSADSESDFRLTEIKGKVTRYMIEPGHSLFRRDFNNNEKSLINDLFQTMGSFDLPDFRQLEELARIAESQYPDYKNKRKCVDFSIKPPENRKLFAQLFHAISENRVIELFYRPMKYISDKNAVASSIEFCPWQIKLFEGRWGLVGMHYETEFILKFYLDQIESFIITEKTYDKEEIKRMDRLYDNIVGMSTPPHLCEKTVNQYTPDSAKIQDIYIWVSPKREQYLRSFPLHDSMDELDPDSSKSRMLREKFPSLPEDGTIFWLSVYITHSLKQAIGSNLDSVVVLEPEELRLEIEERIKNTYALYNKLH